MLHNSIKPHLRYLLKEATKYYEDMFDQMFFKLLLRLKTLVIIIEVSHTCMAFLGPPTKLQEGFIDVIHDAVDLTVQDPTLAPTPPTSDNAPPASDIWWPSLETC